MVVRVLIPNPDYVNARYAERYIDSKGKIVPLPFGIEVRGNEIKKGRIVPIESYLLVEKPDELKDK